MIGRSLVAGFLLAALLPGTWAPIERQGSASVRAADALSVRLSLLRQRSCADFDDSFYEELTLRRAFRNISRSPVTVFLGTDYLAVSEVATNLHEAEEGRFEVKLETDIFLPDISQERPVVLPAGGATDGEMNATVYVRRDTSKKLSFAVDPGRRYLRLTLGVRVRSGSDTQARRRRPALREWSTVTAADLVPVDLPSKPKLVDCRRTN